MRVPSSLVVSVMLRLWLVRTLMMSL